VWSQLPSIRRVALRRAHRVVASARYNVERIAAVQGVRRQRIALIPPVLEPSWGGLAVHDAAHDSPGDSARLLSVARLDAQEGYKGIDAVIRALPTIRSRVPRVSYTVVGAGTDLDRLQRLAEECGVADAVHFAGMVSHPDLLREYEHCDVFVLPSTGEGFGFVFLEAMAFAKAVVAFAVGGPLDIVDDGKTGRLVHAHGELAAALSELLLDPDVAKAMGTRGRARLEELFSFERYVQRWRELLHGLGPTADASA
jgi:phosphatidyl-myo-inositol dimannoside synthase